uniref:Large ribosomal subunit protein bL19c n=1 Tax=Schizocladia ischiensis TaxID=196139 RepID=A0A7S6UA05_9STRA|nr:ribosomal protein L19 [Schizocladia ischiensis]QOW07587.1 ribosomal protein L19 [Schizocladia ischiensis]
MDNFVVTFNKNSLIQSVEHKYYKSDLPTLFIGDTVKIGVLIKEGTKERIQYYQGIIIAKQNTGINKTIIVRRVLQGIGVERMFLIHSPKLNSIEIKRSSRVRKSKLYYLRGLSGKASRLKQRFN